MDKRTEKSILCVDFRKLIERKIINLGGNAETSFSPRGAYFSVYKEVGVHHSTVKNIWMRFCVTKYYDPAPHSGGKKVKLLPADIRFIQCLVRESPSISRGEIKEKLLQFCNVDVSTQAISNVFKTKLSICVWCRFEPALATCETSQVLLASVSGGLPGVLPFRATYRLPRLYE